ncbi:hypothetical protein AJ80_05087 [Polytolypa hystricis UAMH7299]|uniref:Protein kinase domain-containing protein n=1 Tax=Polytolypa hystricis (strain UAMH7299) TaxID=1447883 RepID=A0A2B7Y7B0_POLH7|nr:hypothetical protein AJ80_05087 [Polytolypa hystricis UAMH7299]
MSHWPQLSVVECWFGPREKELEMIVRCKGKCFYIALSPRNFHNSPDILKKYLHFTEVVEADGDLDKPAWEAPQRVTLYDYFNPDTFHYSLLALNNKLPPSLEHQATPRRRQGVDLDDYELHESCPSFRPRQVQICVDRPENAYFQSVKKVLVDEQTICFFKPWGADMEVRVPCLCGVVQQGEEGSQYLGLLLSWVDCQNMTLECALGPETPIVLRQKWADQVTGTLGCLHSAGVIWGGVKAANILVDKNSDIWIIDFGGGYTRGWADKEKAGTIEGDKQGLQNIRDFLFQHDKAKCDDC